jgi:hypothetical protein
MPLIINERRCVACDRLSSREFCSMDCRGRPAPAVYRFICPDGRSYVGSVSDSRHRNGRSGIARSNPWINAALIEHPVETWSYEVLERLPGGWRCSKRELREAEQHHIERLRSWMPEHGFNMQPALSTKVVVCEQCHRIYRQRSNERFCSRSCRRAYLWFAKGGTRQADESLAGIGPDYTVVGRTIWYGPVSLQKWLENGGTRAFEHGPTREAALAERPKTRKPKTAKAGPSIPDSNCEPYRRIKRQPEAT